MLRWLFALAAVSACGDSGGFPDAAVPDTAPSGTFSLSWSVIDQNSAALPCDRIAAQAMTVLTSHEDFLGGATQVFTCKGGMGTSQAVIAGTYTLNFELSGTFGLLATAPPQFGVEVPAGDNVAIAPVQFQVEALGAVDFALASGKSGGNCGAKNAGGAGIDAMTITLTRNSDLACEPITLNISQGATQPGGTYTINCATPVVTGCIEADQRLTATNVDSDAYTIHVRGRIGTKDCYINDDSIQVPPLQKTLMRPLNLTEQMIMGC
jgi:hypothetical protein